MGVGAGDIFCFMRLRSDGTGTVLVGSASGDWLGASIRWRNQRQSIALIEVNPWTFAPERRLMPLSQLSLSSGVNKTIQLKLKEDSPVCELQLRAGVERRAAQAESLLDSPAGMRKSDGGK
jgi:hypothetical protein